ncbi:SDR family NAD(P)-dependent oxidoreductase [Cereibacter sediminicola]|uniref:SDR family NAD(P)-dependent oxidoreductase n=1 Tax=Cereibacter sediminicola TaxID=2584941 RepID=UPI0011A8B539|nr:SDR family NAD(P)-dependent oxidoreductase [Cereibacter sediminicola]
MNLGDRHLFCFGLGYSVRALLPQVMALGMRVSGTVRCEARAADWRAHGVAAHVFDGTAPLPAEAMEGVTDILVSVPPGRFGCPAFLAHRATLVRLPGLVWIGYLSSTAVYGDCGGAWIDESRSVAPQSADALGRVAAERAWSALARHRGAAIDLLRISGIYGPGRSAFDQLRRGGARAIVKPGQVFNRIHVEDIAGSVLSAMSHPAGRRILNLADGCPAASSEVLAHAAALLGLPPPPEVPLEEADLPPVMAAFYAENRRILNGRLRALPGFVLRHPDHHAGLAAILEAERRAQAA